MLRTSAALIVAVLAGSPAVAQPSGGTNAPPMTTKQGVRSNAKSTARLKQINTTKTEQNTGKQRRLRHVVVYHRGGSHRHSALFRHVRHSHRHPVASASDQPIQSNSSDKASKFESTLK